MGAGVGGDVAGTEGACGIDARVELHGDGPHSKAVPWVQDDDADEDDDF